MQRGREGKRRFDFILFTFIETGNIDYGLLLKHFYMILVLVIISIIGAQWHISALSGLLNKIIHSYNSCIYFRNFNFDSIYSLLQCSINVKYFQLWFVVIEILSSIMCHENICGGQRRLHYCVDTNYIVKHTILPAGTLWSFFVDVVRRENYQKRFAPHKSFKNAINYIFWKKNSKTK